MQRLTQRISACSVLIRDVRGEFGFAQILKNGWCVHLGIDPKFYARYYHHLFTFINKYEYRRAYLYDFIEAATYELGNLIAICRLT